MTLELKVQTTLQLDVLPKILNREIQTPRSRLGRHVKGLAEQVLQESIPKIGTTYSGTTGKVTDGRKGHLKDSGKVVNIGGASWGVRFDHPIAKAHHDGVKPREFVKSQLYYNPNPDVWTNSPFEDGHFALKGPFLHPGTAANPYLVEAARQVGLRPSGALRRGPTDLNPVFRTTTLG